MVDMITLNQTLIFPIYNTLHLIVTDAHTNNVNIHSDIHKSVLMGLTKDQCTSYIYTVLIIASCIYVHYIHSH